MNCYKTNVLTNLHYADKDFNQLLFLKLFELLSCCFFSNFINIISKMGV